RSRPTAGRGCARATAGWWVCRSWPGLLTVGAAHGAGRRVVRGGRAPREFPRLPGRTVVGPVPAGVRPRAVRSGTAATPPPGGGRTRHRRRVTAVVAAPRVRRGAVVALASSRACTSRRRAGRPLPTMPYPE